MLVVNFWIIILSVGRRKKSFKFPLTEYFFKTYEESPLKTYKTSLDLTSTLSETFFFGWIAII